MEKLQCIIFCLIVFLMTWSFTSWSRPTEGGPYHWQSFGNQILVEESLHPKIKNMDSLSFEVESLTANFSIVYDGIAYFLTYGEKYVGQFMSNKRYKLFLEEGCLFVDTMTKKGHLLREYKVVVSGADKAKVIAVEN